jgi:hypothetical protein
MSLALLPLGEGVLQHVVAHLESNDESKLREPT